ncbi:MAG: hypothetical protein ACRDU8_06010 [Egibacteraceae bacterium]
MDPTYRAWTPDEAEAAARLLHDHPWPFHAFQYPSLDEARERVRGYGQDAGTVTPVDWDDEPQPSGTLSE